MSYQKHNFTPGAVLLASQLNDMDNEIETLSQGETVLSDDFKEALLNCFENVAWINENGQTYYDALYDSLYPDNMWFITNILNGCVTSNNATSILKNNSYVATITANEGYTLDGATVSITIGGNDVTNLYYSSGSINIPNVTGDLVITVSAVSAVTSITAVFTQGSAIIYDMDSLDTLKQYLTVTATYSDSTTAVVTDYTLSGTLEVGTSTITVSYGGKTDTFSVTVTATPFEYGEYIPDSVVRGKYIDKTGAIVDTTDNSGYIEDYIRVVRESYWFAYLNPPYATSTANPNVTNANWRISEYAADKSFIKQTQYAQVVDGVEVNLNYASRIHVFDTNTKFVRLGWYDSRSITSVARFYIGDPTTFELLTMESGDIDGTTGANKTGNTRIRTKGYIAAENTISFSGCPFASSWSGWDSTSGYAFRCYDSNYGFIGSLTDGGQLFTNDISAVSLPTGTAYVRIFMQRNAKTLASFAHLVNRIITINSVEYCVSED